MIAKCFCGLFSDVQREDDSPQKPVIVIIIDDALTIQLALDVHVEVLCHIFKMYGHHWLCIVDLEKEK